MKTLVTALKILLALILLSLLALGIYWLVNRQGWPWWVGAAMGLGLFGLILGFLFLRKYLFRKREERFVKRIVEMDESVTPTEVVTERQALRDLEKRWAEAMTVLRRSLLRKRGNPLYVLPWYLVMGETGSGKTSAIQSAGLLSPLTGVSASPAGGGTRNCDWWFFDKAVVLDTAGRYTIPVDEIGDKEEWERFLKLLAKHRRKEPISGLMLTIGADKLTTASADELIQDGRAIRRRVDETMRVLGAKFPIYLVVTKTDLLAGMVEYARLLPDGALNQALGHSDVKGVHAPEDFVDQAVEAVTRRLKELRLLYLNRTEPTPGLLLFPDELGRLRSRLQDFATALFEENPYQETPLLRGVYFTSARQVGHSRSQLLSDLSALQDRREALPGTHDGFFLHDVFDRVLPEDRYLYQPLKEYLSWRRMTQGLGVAAWAALILFGCGLLTLSYYKNMETLNTFIQQMPAPPALTMDLGKDIIIMSSLRARLLEMEALNRDWWTPRLGLDESLTAEQMLKAQYCEMFREGFLSRLDLKLTREIGGFSAETQGEVIGAFVEHLETRINLLIAELNGETLAGLEKMPQPSHTAMVVIDRQIIPEVAAEFGRLYLSYIHWNPDRNTLNLELGDLRGWLRQVSEVRGANLNWMVNWANVQPTLEAVTLNKFWGSYRPATGDEVQVPAAYTVQGRKAIEDFLARYQASLENPALLQPRVVEFNAWYWRQYVDAWLDFSQNFVEGYLNLQSEDDMRVLAQMMADPKNPYFLLLDRMAVELNPVNEMEGTPTWVRIVVTFPRVKQQAAQEKLMQTAGTVTKAAQKGLETIEKVTQAGGTADTDEVERLERIVKAAEQLREYEKALAEIIPVTSSRQKAYDMASALYHTGDAKDTESDSPFRKAYAAFIGLRGTVLQHGQRDNVFWQLFTGPLYFLLAYATYEAGCELQNEWEGSVLAEIQEMPEVKIRDTLFKEKEGLVWKFVNGPARPFLTRDLRGFYPRTTLNQPFPFEQNFLSFLNEGASQTSQLLPEYTVGIQVRPTTVNPEAPMEPYATELVMECQDGNQQLKNYNFPSDLAFKWKPDICGDVTLKILFNDITLTRRYPGVNGFPGFLDEFRDGTKTFVPADFPDQEQVLERMGISELKVSYVISGSDPVKRLEESSTFHIPLSVARCWGS